MRILRTTCAGLVVLLNVTLAAQTKPDFTGQWVLIDARNTQGVGAPIVAITAARELNVDQSGTGLKVEHSLPPGTHPKPQTVDFGLGGVVGPDGRRSSSDAFWFGHQLLIGTSSTDAVGNTGVPPTVESSELWSLESNGTLVIEVTERRPGSVDKLTLTYRKR